MNVYRTVVVDEVPKLHWLCRLSNKLGIHWFHKWDIVKIKRYTYDDFALVQCRRCGKKEEIIYDGWFE